MQGEKIRVVNEMKSNDLQGRFSKRQISMETQPLLHRVGRCVCVSVSPTHIFRTCRSFKCGSAELVCLRN